MKVSKISIKNILGLESLEIEPGSVTQIFGENGAGKTSVLEAIRCALSGGSDATLLRNGAEHGEVILILDDGTEIQRKITADDSSVVVKHPTYGKISKPAAYLKKLSDALSLNPVQFLTASKKDRVDQLLQAIPMTVTADQISFVPVTALNGVSLDGHALEVIGKIARSIYDLRTGVNRAEKEKRATAKQMSETLPADAPEGNWGDVLQAANSDYQKLQKATAAHLSAIDQKANETKKAAKDEADNHIAKVKEELDAAIERLRADSQIEIERTREGAQKVIEAAESDRMDRRKFAESEYRPKESDLKEKIGQAKTMIEQHTRAEATREFIQSLTQDSDKLEIESTKLTDALGKLENLKANLLENIPVEGLEIRDGDIYVGGIPFDRVNESKRIRLAIEIAKLRAGSLGLVAVDGLERLDEKTFAAFKKEAAKSRLQFVISRVSEGPLAIETEVA